ncbi:MAG: cell division protein FtsQ/DivIB [Mariprofundaceae bacterium]
MSRRNQHRVSAEERRMSRRHIWRYLRLAMLSVLLLGGSSAGLWWLNEALTVTTWSITGNAQLKAAIEKKLADMPEKSYLHTRPSALHDAWLASIPDMAEVQINRVLPDTLLIVAKARVPLALWQDELGAIHLVDKNGVAYRPLARGESPDLPMLRIAGEELAQAHTLLTELAGLHVRNMAALSEVRSSDAAWLLYFSKGERWLIPQQHESDVFNRLDALLAQPRWRTRSWRIDARSTSRWFIRPAKHEGVI